MNHQYTDKAGNVHELFNAEKIAESAFFLASPGHEDIFSIDYPLNIFFSGSGIWLKGARQRRRRCTIFAIEMVTAGNMRLIQDGKEYIIEKGMAFTLRPGTTVDAMVGDKGFMHKRFLEIAGPRLDVLREHCGLTDCDTIVSGDPSHLGALMKKATHLLRARPENYAHALALLAYDIMLTLSRETAGTRYPPAVNAVLHFLSRNIERAVTIEELCGVACLSRPHLYRVFKKHLMDAPLNYFTKMRIRHAAMMLRSSPQRSVGDIAYQFAFEDQAYFSNLFRKIMGTSPAAYRKREPSRKPASSQTEMRR